MSICLSFHRYGGFYFFRGCTWRLSLGWVSLTWYSATVESLLEKYERKVTEARKVEQDRCVTLVRRYQPVGEPPHDLLRAIRHGDLA